ncbi:MAG: sulfite exporter TauE/SafE family protein [Bacteroidetes bacterium]|nr:MAG: sulfite exporter TauE/SafE family protein [Bacteroidota bacterium]
MEWLHEFATTTSWPLLGAFALGLLAAISPCPLATNLTATAYIAKGFQDKRGVLLSGALYTMGRALAYMALAAIIYFGASRFHVARFMQQHGEKWLAPLLVLVGLVMLGLIPLRLPVGGFTHWVQRLQLTGYRGATLLGVLFALAFCPYSAALFFGTLVPMTLQNSAGLSLPLLFALGTGLPVLIFAFLLAYSAERVGVLFATMQKVDRVMRYAVGGIFVLTGLYLGLMLWG